MSAVLKETVSPVVDAAEQRYNIYTVIHKALRAFMTDTLLKLGNFDPSDEAECSAAIAQLRGLLAMCSGHLHHENTFVHAAIERVLPGRAARTAQDHVQHEAEIAELEHEVARFESMPAWQRGPAARKLYLELSRFVAENFLHMLVEETENHAALIEACDEQQVLQIEHAIVASLPPEAKFAAMQWMIPYCNAKERAFLLGGMQRNAPQEIFQAVLGLARDSLNQRDYFKLERALG